VGTDSFTRLFCCGSKKRTEPPSGEAMLKQQVVNTSMGPLTVSSLTLGELRQLDALLTEHVAGSGGGGLSTLLRYMPVMHTSLRKVHQDLTLEQLENSLGLYDFNQLFAVLLEVSGLKKAEAGEATPVPA
jgi:hypothetical protein